MGGATNTLTFSSTSLYFAFPRTTCFPGAPVRWPPGRNACRVPVVTLTEVRCVLQDVRRPMRGPTDPCSSPCYRAWA